MNSESAMPMMSMIAKAMSWNEFSHMCKPNNVAVRLVFFHFATIKIFNFEKSKWLILDLLTI